MSLFLSIYFWFCAALWQAVGAFDLRRTMISDLARSATASRDLTHSTQLQGRASSLGLQHTGLSQTGVGEEGREAQQVSSRA